MPAERLRWTQALLGVFFNESSGQLPEDFVPRPRLTPPPPGQRIAGARTGFSVRTRPGRHV